MTPSVPLRASRVVSTPHSGHPSWTGSTLRRRVSRSRVWRPATTLLCGDAVALMSQYVRPQAGAQIRLVKIGAKASTLPVAGTYDVRRRRRRRRDDRRAHRAELGLSVVVSRRHRRFGGSAGRSGSGSGSRTTRDPRAPGVPDTPALAASTSPPSPADGSTPARQAAFCQRPGDARLRDGPQPAAVQVDGRLLRLLSGAARRDAGGRSIEPDVIDGHILGAELANLNPAYLPVPAGLWSSSQDYKWIRPRRGERPGRGGRRRGRRARGRRRAGRAEAADHGPVVATGCARA